MTDNPYNLDLQIQELQRLGFEILRTEPMTAIAKRRTFYWECMLTYLNYTVFVRRVERLTAEMIAQERDAFLRDSKTLNQSRLPRGFQSGNAILVAYIADSIDEEAQRLCERNPTKHFAQFYQTAAINTQTGTLHLLKKTPLWGAIYFGKFKYLLRRLLLPQAPSQEEPLSKFGLVLTVLLIGWLGLLLLLFILILFLS